jgi:UDP-N-acetylenolpyruvoylglucosamine reductase
MGKIKIYKSYNLKYKTTFKIGGKAEYYCEPKSLIQFQEAVFFAKKK